MEYLERVRRKRQEISLCVSTLVPLPLCHVTGPVGKVPVPQFPLPVFPCSTYSFTQPTGARKDPPRPVFSASIKQEVDQRLETMTIINQWASKATNPTWKGLANYLTMPGNQGDLEIVAWFFLKDKMQQLVSSPGKSTFPTYHSIPQNSSTMHYFVL